MLWRNIKIFCRHYLHALHVGIPRNALGFGALVGAIILPILGLPEMIQEWTLPIVGAALGVIVVTITHLFVIAPYRAYRMVRPFVIEVKAGHLETTYPPMQFEPQKAAILVRNRAYLPMSDCVLHIMGIESASDDIQFPRFITGFSIDAKMTKQLVFATWTLRKLPYDNDSSIFF
jgi:hypothetical protein